MAARGADLPRPELRGRAFTTGESPAFDSASRTAGVMARSTADDPVHSVTRRPVAPAAATSARAALTSGATEALRLPGVPGGIMRAVARAPVVNEASR